MRMMAVKVAFAAAGLLAAAAAGADPFEDSFYPYKNGFPTADGITPGMTIDQTNVDQFKDSIDSASFRFVKNGWYTIKVIATREFTLHPNYIEASKANIGKVTLDEFNRLVGYTAGRAFPADPDPNDPQAGIKMVWNYQYGFNAGDSETIDPFWWTFRDMKSGKVERVIKFQWHFMNWIHRVVFDPKPAFADNPSKIYRSGYSIALEPFDLANTQLLIHRYEDDQQRDDAWLYLGFQRRVRRLATGQRTDAFLGTDVMIEDFEGYNGRIFDYDWEYGGTRNMLVPFYNHNEIDLEPEAPGTPDGFKFAKNGGLAGCWPDVPWQLRKIHVLIGKPKDPNHPLSHRDIYLDAETMVMPILHIWDKKGDFWKLQYISKAHSDSHHPKNKGAGVPVETMAGLIDEQAMHCTTLQFRSIINAEENQPPVFSVQNMRKEGR
ncbi:MAG: DUF1329 domain-containing protein [Gammaproteobacteria bacterium]|nr:DUF1329 domain-containing protein [Gammaproteobacteria bacterium]